jgi:hypothetical protein
VLLVQQANLTMDATQALWTAAALDPVTLQGLGLTTVSIASLPAPYPRATRATLQALPAARRRR